MQGVRVVIVFSEDLFITAVGTDHEKMRGKLVSREDLFITAVGTE